MSVTVNCPQCGRSLKLPDRSMLGRKGKCPKCGHAFILQAAEPPAAKAETAPPDKPKPRPEKIEKPTDPDPINPFANLAIEMAAPPPKEPEPEFQFQIPTSSDHSPQASSFPSAFPTFEPSEATRTVKSPRHKQQTSRSTRTYLIVGIIVAVTAGGLGISAWLFSKPVAVATNSTPQPQSETKTETPETANEVTDSSGADYASLGAPTKGEPIELRYIPFGSELVIHLHPAELWGESPLMTELRECIPPIDRSLQMLIRDLCKADPQQIDEMLICLIPGNRTNAPEIAAVAHFIDELDQSQFDKRFGKRNPDYEQFISVQGDRACLMIDPKSIAVCPKSQIDEMIQAIDAPHPSNQLDPLLPTTDRDRQVTVIALPQTLRLYESWFPENVRPLLNAVVNWFGERVDAVAWSIHLTPELFYSDLVIREKSGLSAKSNDDVARRLPKLAESLLSLIERMDPKENGPRTIIGRFPAMIEVFSMATVTQRSPHQIRLITALPDRAAPNLFLAEYLAWDESTRTDFSKSSPSPKDLTNLPDTIAERLNKRVDVDFRGTPFSEAFAFLSQEIATPIDIDGDALKAGGFTKNLKQTFQMDGVPAKDVVQRIFEESKGISDNPEKSLVMVVNEVQKRILITTKKKAK